MTSLLGNASDLCYDYPQRHDTKSICIFLSPDTSNITGSVRLYAPSTGAACNAHKSGLLKKHISLIGWDCLEIGRLAEVTWIPVGNKDEGKGNPILVSVLWRKNTGKSSDPAYLQNKTNFCLRAYRFRRPSMFYSGCCICFYRLYEAEPHEITSTLLSSLLTTFTLIPLSKFPLRLQATSHTSRINTVKVIRCQGWSERDWLLLAIVYVRKYTGCFLC